MDTTRFKQLIDMYMYITKLSFTEAEKDILSTFAGKAIANNNSAYLYEQHTNNLEDIVRELPIEKQKKFSDESIQEAFKIINYPTYYNFKIAAKPQYKTKNKKRLLYKQQEVFKNMFKNMLLVNKANKSSKF